MQCSRKVPINTNHFYFPSMQINQETPTVEEVVASLQNLTVAVMIVKMVEVEGVSFDAVRTLLQARV